MEGDPGAAEKLYRLRLVLPDLSQSFEGNWLASLEKAIPPDLFHDYDGLFDAPEPKRNGGLNASKQSHVEFQPKHQAPALDDADREYTRQQSGTTGNSDDLWLRAGEMEPCGPVLHSWEVCHGLENWLLEKASEDFQERTSPQTEIWSTLFQSGSDDSKLNAVELLSKSAAGALSKIIPESDLVRDSLYALQGLPAAVRKLERLSKTYCTTSADKSSHDMSTLWTRSVTASALGKILSVVARAGHVRCQLDAFVRFFLDDRLDPYELKRGDGPSLSKKASKKRTKKRVEAQVKEVEKHIISAKSPVNATATSKEKVPHHCLVNQAFAAAVKGILRGHSAALNTLAASVSLRRDQEPDQSSIAEDWREQDPGPVIGYGSRDISLLEFYLHTRELRVQLHALAFICLMRDGKSFVGRSISDDRTEDFTDRKENDRLQGPGKGRKYNKTGDATSDLLVRSFDNFPRGADLLTYLYDQLMEVDPLHLELLRFLFERAYEPYSIFIQSWLYKAAVMDPYGEFIIEQADFSAVPSDSMVQAKLVADPHPMDLKLRSGLFVPRFMENICTPLVRAGEQLQVLLKLEDTCELAQQMANNVRASETFWPQNCSQSPMESSKSSSLLPALVFSKTKLDETAKQREKKSQEMSEQFDILFTELASRRIKKDKSRTISRSTTPTNLPLDVSVDDIEKKRILITDPDPQMQTSLEPASNLPASQQLTEREHLKITVTLPKRGWVTSAEDEAAERNSLATSKSKSQSLWQVGFKDGLAGLATKETEKAGVSDLPLDYQDPNEFWFLSDPTRANKVAESGKGSSEVQSLISGHQRGTSWPLWGLPINPFLVQADTEDYAPNTYVHPSFLGTYQHWDVTAKSTIATISSNHTTFLEKSRESSRHGRESNIEPQWFASLETTLNDQLFAGLDAQLKLPSWGQADVGHTQRESRQYLDQVLVELDQRLTHPLGFSGEDLQEPEVLVPVEHSYRSIDALNSSPVFPLESNAPADLSSPQILLDPFNCLSDSQSESLAHTISSQSTIVQDLPQRSLAESESASGEKRLFPLNPEFRDGIDLSEHYFTELYPFNGENDVSRLPETNETQSTLGKPSQLSELGDVEDESRDTRSGTVALQSDISAFDQRKVDLSSEQVNSHSLDSGLAPGAAKWEQHLRFTDDGLSPAAIQKTTTDGIDEDEDCADDEIPLSVVVSKCIADEILSQYQSVSTLTVRLFQEGLCLQDHYNALRRYFFMERGDWAEYFTAALCQHKWGPLGGQLRQMEVQGMLEAAFQRSSCEGDEYAERVYVSFQESRYYCENLIHGSAKTSISSFVDCSRLDAFDFIALQYRVDWPLSLILTSHSLGLYNVVFTFLMRIKLTVHALGDIWQRLQVIDRSLHKKRGSSTCQQRNRFRSLQQFRQQIYHFVTTVQQYVESKLLNVVWSKFLQDIELEVNDMQDLEIVHCAYLEDATDECFLSTKTRGVKGCIDSIMQCVLDFSSHMRNAFYRNSEKLDLIDDGLFMQVHQVKKGFQASLQQLHGYHMKQEPQSRTNLVDLWMILDYNGFLTAALSTAHL